MSERELTAEELTELERLSTLEVDADDGRTLWARSGTLVIATFEESNLAERFARALPWLLRAARERDELRKNVKDCMHIRKTEGAQYEEENAWLRAQLGAANERVKALEAALRFYAGDLDYGHEARAALAKLDPDGTGEGAAT